MTFQAEFDPSAGACRICGATVQQEVVGRERQLDLGQCLIRCGQCSTCYLSPDFTPASLSKFYEKAYRQLFSSEAVEAPDAAYFAQVLSIGQVRVGLYARLIPEGGAVFELGSGLGGFLQALHKARPDIRLFANEPDKAARVKVLGDAPVRFIDEDEDIGISFDAIFAFHVVEHLRDPVGALIKLRRLLKPSGALVIEVPDIFAPWSGWQDVHPAHLSYFSTPSLAHVLDLTGYQIEQVGAVANTEMLGHSLAAVAWNLRPANAPVPIDVAALDAHIRQYRWRARDSLRRSVKLMLIRIFGVSLVGRLQRAARRGAAAIEQI